MVLSLSFLFFSLFSYSRFCFLLSAATPATQKRVHLFFFLWAQLLSSLISLTVHENQAMAVSEFFKFMVTREGERKTSIIMAPHRCHCVCQAPMSHTVTQEHALPPFLAGPANLSSLFAEPQPCTSKLS